MSKYLLTLACILSGCSTSYDPIAYENPSEDYIDVVGTIDEGLKYKMMVQYRAESSSRTCKSYNFLTGSELDNRKEYEYLPEIKSTHHKIRLPLKAISPETSCNWKPDTVMLCITSSRDKEEPHTCGSLFFISGEEHDAKEITEMACSDSGWCFEKGKNPHTSHLKYLNKTYIVNIRKKT